MTQFLRKIWAIFAIAILLVSQTSGALARGNLSPNAPNQLTPPTLVAPADGAQTNDTTPAFTWQADPDPAAVTYQFQLDDTNDFSSPVIDISQPGTGFAPGAALAEGAYFWRVQSGDGVGGWSGWSTVWSLTVDTTPPAAPAQLSPGDASLTNDNTPTFSWSVPDGASQYQIQIDNNNNLNSPLIDLQVGSASFTPGSTLGDGTYYWWVKAFDAAGNASGWSTIWSLVIDATPPGPPNLTSPADGVSTNDNTPTFSWSTSGGASQYILQVSTSNGFGTLVVNQTQAATSFTSGVLTDGVYYWRVSASDLAGNTSPWSTVRSLTIDTLAPGAPVLSAPADAALITDNTPTFSWNASTSASQYTLQVSTAADFSSLVINQSQAGISFTPGVAMADGLYYWRVNANDLAGNTSAWSATWSLTIDTLPPAVPSLLTPLDAAALADTTPDFTWNAVPDAVSYRLQIDSDVNFSPSLENVLVNGTSFTLGTPLNEGVYYWHLRASDAAGNNSVYSTIRSFTIDTTPPPAPILASPADGSISADNTPVFTWNASNGASQYRVQVDNNNNFLTPEIDQWAGVTNLTPISGLIDGTYFWHVQASDAAGNLSGWSTAWSVVIDATAPGAPSLLTPADMSLTNDNTPTFTWSSVAGASQYRLQVSTAVDFSVLAINQTLAGTSFAPVSPLGDGIYYWRVNAVDSIGNTGAWSTVWSLTVDTTLPIAPSLVAPANASFTAINTPTFEWSAVSGAAQYHLQVSTAIDFASQVINQTLPGTTFTPVSSLADGVYYWRVNASDLAGNTGVWSVIRSFTVDTLPPAVPGLLAPPDGAALNDTTPDFSWSVVVDAVSYRLQIDTDVNFAAPVLQNLTVNVASFTLVTPLTEGVYYWHVRASDAAGNASAYSLTRSFTIDTTPPAVPVLTAPGNGALTNDTTPAFTWNASTGASQYQIQVDDSSDLLSPIISELVGSTGFTPASGLADGIYYWHVRAIDAAGNLSGWSTAWSLVVDTTGLGAPTLVAPLDGAFTNDNTPAFSWNAVAGTVQYQIQVDDDPGFLSLNFEQFTTATSISPAASLSDAVLYWRVRAQDAANNWSVWSLVRSFTIDTLIPAAPALVAPVDATTTADNTPTFSWSSVAGAVSYRLMVDTSSSFTSPFTIDQTLSGLDYTAASALADAKYYWRVRAIDAAGNLSSWSAVRSFTIDTTPSSVPTLISPGNGAILADATPTFTWGASTGAVLYFIQVDDNSNFSSPLINTSTANTSYTPASALADGTYFWHVQAKDAVDNLSAWSAAWSLVIDSTPPGVPSLVSPPDNLVTNDNTPTFTWSIPSGAVQTNIQVDDNSNFSSPLADQTVSGSSFTWDTSFVDGSYFWHVRALDAAGNLSGWSAVRSFSIDTTPPDAPVLLAPDPGSNTVDNTPTFDWTSPSGATQYKIQAYTGDNFTTLAIDELVPQSTFTALPLAQGLYRWRVLAGDAANNWAAAWSDPRELTIYSFVTPIFQDGFESGALGNGWSVILRNEGRVRVAGNLVPGAVQSGSYSLFLDDYLAGSNTSASQAVAVLTSDLSGVSVATLSFFYRSFGGAGSADAVYISDDYGLNWCKIMQFASNQSTYISQQFNLIAEATRCNLVLNDHFQVKFQFFGFYGITDGANAEGFGIDNIRLVGLKPVAYLPLIRR